MRYHHQRISGTEQPFTNQMRYRVDLSKDERDLILDTDSPSPELTQRLRFGLVNGKPIHYEFEAHLLEELLSLTIEKAAQGKTRAVRRRFGRLEERLRKIRNEAFSDVAGQDLPGILPDEVKAELQHTLSTDSYGSLDEVNEAISRVTDKHNTRPRREFHGLSPEQISRLLHFEWNTPESPIHLNTRLQEKDFINAPILQMAREFLNAISTAPAKATTSGNLNRKFVAQMLQEMTWPDGYLESLHKYNKVINEEDAWPLHVLRVVLQEAGLIRKYKSSYRITKRGDNCRKKAYPNELYLSLFLTYFAKFNLAYLDRCPPCPAVQYTFAYSLFVLSTRAGKWMKVKSLPSKIFLPVAQEEMDADRQSDKSIITETRIIKPLESFGLIECQREQGRYLLELKRIRATRLFNEFVTFDN